jgi:4-amino-4-deoxy-L-arabinose transferase-like glycosyltransferase
MKARLVKESLGFTIVGKSEWSILALLLVWGAFVHYQQLSFPVISDEAMYASVGRWLARTHEWFHLRYEGDPFLYKPPLHFWLMALSIRVWGPTEFAVRFPSATFGMATLLLVYFAGKSLFRPRVGLFAGLILSTTFVFVWLARRGKIDVPLGLLMNLAFFSFCMAYREERRRGGYLWLSFASMAIATMLKGPLGFLLPGAGGFLFLLLTRKRNTIRELPALLAGMSGFLAVVSAYYWSLGAEFNRYFFVVENLDRIVEESKPTFFYFYMLLPDLFPWCLFLPAAIVYASRLYRQGIDREMLLIVLWVFAFFLPLNLPSYKEEDFLVYVAPPFALLLAVYWDAIVAPREGPPGASRFLWASAMALFIAVGAAAFLGHALLQMRFPEFPEFLPLGLRISIVALCLSGLYAVYKRSAAVLFATVVAVAMALTIGVVQFHSRALEQYIAARRIGQEIRSIVGNSRLVFSFPRGHSEVVFYLDRSRPGQNIGSVDELHRLFGSNQLLFGLLSRETYEMLNARGGPSPVRLGEYSDRKSRYVLVTNANEAKIEHRQQ